MTDKDLLQAGYRYALTLTHHHSDAEDIIQEAWLKLLAAYGEVRNKSLFFTSIRNIYIDKQRRNNLIVIESMDNTGDIVESKDTMTTIFACDDIEIALSHLRSEEREAIYLNVVEGYSAKEIANLTERSRNTVLSLIHRGKQKLSKILSNQSYADSYHGT